jgi:hypothetical protein
MMDQYDLPVSTRDESRDLAVGLIGTKVTDAFYDANQLVFEFDRTLRLQFSPKGPYVSTKPL